MNLVLPKGTKQKLEVKDGKAFGPKIDEDGEHSELQIANTVWNWKVTGDVQFRKSVVTAVDAIGTKQIFCCYTAKRGHPFQNHWRKRTLPFGGPVRLKWCSCKRTITKDMMFFNGKRVGEPKVDTMSQRTIDEDFCWQPV